MHHIYGMDLLRFIAALFIVLLHFSAYSVDSPVLTDVQSDLAFPWLAPMGSFGWVGVQIFFTLSGFVIIASAMHSSVITFLKRRAIRIFPALWICGAIALIVRLVSGEPIGDRLADFFRSAILSPKGPYIDGVVWTLVVEAAFYLAVALMIHVRGRSSLGNGVFLLGALVIGLTSCAFVAFRFLAISGEWVLGGQAAASLLDWFPLRVLLLQHGVFFALGIVFYYIHLSGATASKLALFAFFAVFGMLEIYTASDGGTSAIAPLFIFTLFLALMQVFVRYNIRWFYSVRPRWLILAGLLSYPIYLNHHILGMYMTAHFVEGSGNGWSFLAILSVILVTSWLIMVGPERALQRIGKRILLAEPQDDGTASSVLARTQPHVGSAMRDRDRR